MKLGQSGDKVKYLVDKSDNECEWLVSCLKNKIKRCIDEIINWIY